MKIAIIGAGFTGLTAALRLSKKGHMVTVFESSSKAGGLALGFRRKNWKWSLEEHYHHWFTNDSDILNLASEINHKVITVRPKTSTLYDNEINQLDSPLSLLRFNKLSLVGRIRCGVTLLYLKLTPTWHSLENISSEKFLIKTMGNQAWDVLWKPLFTKKFGRFYKKVPAVWFWARIKKRTPSLSYPQGGFQDFADKLTKVVIKNGVNIIFNSKIVKIASKNQMPVLAAGNKSLKFDRVICTLPTPLFLKLGRGLTPEYVKSIKKLEGLGAVNLVLRLKNKFLKDGTYWLNVNQEDFPFLAVVEHTNFMSTRNYGNENLVYIGNYLESGHEYFGKDANELINIFYPFLKKIRPEFNKTWIKGGQVFKANFAQPVFPFKYSKYMIPFETPLKNVFLANIQQVYPWDRGTIYAVELGDKIASIVG